MNTKTEYTNELIEFFNTLDALGTPAEWNGGYQQYLFDHFLALNVSVSDMTVADLLKLINDSREAYENRFSRSAYIRTER